MRNSCATSGRDHVAVHLGHLWTHLGAARRPDRRAVVIDETHVGTSHLPRERPELVEPVKVPAALRVIGRGERRGELIFADRALLIEVGAETATEVEVDHDGRQQR